MSNDVRRVRNASGDPAGAVPREGPAVAPPPVAPDAAAHAIALFEQWSVGHFDEVRRDFDPILTETLGAAAITDAWKQVVDVVGAYERMGEPSVYRQADHTIVDLPLEFESGPMKGRVAYNDQGRVAGLFILVSMSTDSA